MLHKVSGSYSLKSLFLTPKNNHIINNTEEMMDALVEDYFRYDELAQMEAEANRHNITGSDTEVLEYRELDEVPRELISNVEIGEKENQ
jgi:hypothetical protein